MYFNYFSTYRRELLTFGTYSTGGYMWSISKGCAVFLVILQTVDFELLTFLIFLSVLLSLSKIPNVQLQYDL